MSESPTDTGGQQSGDASPTQSITAQDEAVIAQLKAIAHPLRLTILRALHSGEHNVGEIEAATGIGQPALSQQLGVLRRAKLVETRKQSKLIYYRMSAGQMEVIVETINQLISPDIAQGKHQDSDRQKPNVTPKLISERAPGVANFARIF